jgi:branched-chain amino acid transport system substrate-binding protein
VRRALLAPGRAAVGLRIACLAAFLALTVGAGSCTGSRATSVKATGPTLTIYLSGSGGAGSADVLAAERLAFQQKRGELKAFGVRLEQVNGSPSANARKAIEDTTTIAYIGELTPGASADSLGITNDQGVLQVSPTDTAIELTQATAAVPGAPDDLYEALSTYGRTFARVVPSAAQEARFEARRIAALGVKTLYVASDGSPYGAAIALAVRHDARAAGLTVANAAAGADGAFYGSASAAAVAPKYASLAAANPKIDLFGPSALVGGSFPATLSHLYLSVPGFLPKALPSAGRTFAADFKAAYGHAPALQAIFGYEAVAAVVDDLRRLGAGANDRAKVVRGFFQGSNPQSVLGAYSINANGDTSIAPFVLEQLRAGVLVPLR